MKPQINILITLVIIFLTGCTKDVDFDQIDDANVQTSFIVTLVSAEFTAPKFLNEFNEEIPFTLDFIQAKVADSGQDYLEKIELTIFTENTFNRNFLLNFRMYNIEGDLIYEVEPSVVISPNSVETTIIEIPQEDIHFLYEADYFGFTFILPPTNNPDDHFQMDTEGVLKLKSSMELFFNFRKI